VEAGLGGAVWDDAKVLDLLADPAERADIVAAPKVAAR
jgi:hypothetical protein